MALSLVSSRHKRPWKRRETRSLFHGFHRPCDDVFVHHVSGRYCGLTEHAVLRQMRRRHHLRGRSIDAAYSRQPAAASRDKVELDVAMSLAYGLEARFGVRTGPMTRAIGLARPVGAVAAPARRAGRITVWARSRG